MRSNDSRPSKKKPTRRRGGDSPWKGVCLGSLCAALALLALSALLKGQSANPRGSTGFVMLDGLLALAELLSWVMAGVGGIGWMLTRSASR